MNFPHYFRIGSLEIHPHPVFEALAYFVGFQVYLRLRAANGDVLDERGRWRVLAAATIGAAMGSKILYWFEDPRLLLLHWHDSAFLLGGKTVVGALIGGLVVVEAAKWKLGIVRRTGDLLAIPLSVGIAIGRVGCFLTGIQDHTAGILTSLPWGIDFGDGVTRHPAQLYEVAFMGALAIILWRFGKRLPLEGDVFKLFMVSYFAFRLACDFLKPDVAVFAGLSSIQCACVIMLCYYSRDVGRWCRKSRAATVSHSEDNLIPGFGNPYSSEGTSR